MILKVAYRIGRLHCNALQRDQSWELTQAVSILTTQIPDTELLARNVHILPGFVKPDDTRWFLVQLYVGNCTFNAFFSGDKDV